MCVCVCVCVYICGKVDNLKLTIDSIIFCSLLETELRQNKNMTIIRHLCKAGLKSMVADKHSCY